MCILWHTFSYLACDHHSVPCAPSQVLHLDLTKSSLLSVLPWMTMALSANLGGWLADNLVDRGVSVTAVRKVCVWRVMEGCLCLTSLTGVTNTLKDASTQSAQVYTFTRLNERMPNCCCVPSISSPTQGMQTVGFLGPAFFLSQLSGVSSVYAAVGCMMGAQGLDAFSQSGLYSNHQDIGPR